MRELGMFFSLLIVASAAFANVVVLDDSNFDKMLSEKSPMLVEFYAPWCGHCKSLEPEYEAAGKILAEKNAPVFLGKVDATDEKCAELAKKFKIQGFPTLKYFSSATGKPSEFDGERNSKSIVGWLMKKIGPAFAKLASASEVEALKESVVKASDKLAVVGVFENADQMTAFETQAKGDNDREYFAVVGDAAVAGAVDKSAKAPFVTMLRSFDSSNPALLTDAAVIGDAKKLAKFIASSSEPPSDVTTYTGDDVVEAKNGGIHLIEFYAPWCGYCKQFAPEYEKVAKKLSADGKMVVAKMDGTAFEDVANDEQVEGFPTVKLYKDGASAVFNGELNEDAVISWVEQKLVAKAEKIEDAQVAEFSKKFETLLVVCVSAANEAAVDLLAFQDGGNDFGVVKTSCADGKENAKMYTSGAELASTELPVSDAGFRKWYKRASLKPVFRFEDHLFDKVMEAEYQYLVFYLDNTLKGTEAPLKVLEEVATTGKYPKAAFTYADSADEYLLQYFNVKAEDMPAIRLLDISGDLKAFVGPSGDITKDKVETMFKDLEDDKLEQIEQPEDDDDYGEDEYAEGEGEDDYDDEEGADDYEDEEENADEL